MIIVNYFFFYSLLFFIGILGLILNRDNLILILVSIEMILLSIVLNFNLFAYYLDDVMGEIFSLIILTVAAAESAIGLAIIIIYFRNKGTIQINSLKLLSH